VTELQIRFGSGRDVLNAYWGYLSDGGLVVPDEQGLAVGASVALEIQIDSTQTRYALLGSVVRRERGGRMVVRFSPGEPHDVLLTDALSETDNVPARRHRRYRADTSAGLIGPATRDTRCRLVDISEEGCCVELTADEAAAIPVGTPLTVAWDDIQVAGKVVWARHTERGVVFAAGARSPALRAFVQRLASAPRRGTTVDAAP
jgi:Tfp pilus assembly protein PilZ